MLGADVNGATAGLCTICKQLCGNLSMFPSVDSRGNVPCRWQNLHHVNLMILGGAVRALTAGFPLQGNWAHLSISPKEGSDVVMK